MQTPKTTLIYFDDSEFKYQAKLLFEELYPALFDKLEELQAAAKSCEYLEHEKSDLLALLNKINLELDEMYRKEKLVLFPYLQKLVTERSSLENCKPLLNIRNQSAAILNLIKSVTQLLQPHQDLEEVARFLKNIDYFELDLTNTFKSKEAVIFERFLASDSIYYSA